MATINQKFIDGYLNNKVLESIKPLNEIKDCLHPKEVALIGKINLIIEQILSLEL